MKLSEVYTSVQGEGPNTGKPITFIRFGGCNLRCPGWGTGLLPDGTEVPGCDTVFAVYPEWRATWDSCSPSEVYDLIPEGEPRRVCLTGGEPLIQPSKQLSELAGLLYDNGYKIDLFTNGTQVLPLWAQSEMTTVVMDWKLPGSGEWESFNLENLNKLNYYKDSIKFVCKHQTDFDIALDTIERYDLVARVRNIWFGPVWNQMDPAYLAELVEEHFPEGRLNIQTHKYIWHPDERRR